MYEPIVFPISGALRDMDKKSIQGFFEWFVATIPSRIKVLENAVRSGPTTKAWKADSSPASLQQLGEWYVKHVTTRQRTSAEVSAMRQRLTIPVEIEGWDLDEPTYSLAVDVGIYLGEVLRTGCEKLKWGVIVKDKRFVDYGCPVITGFGRAVMNPVRICAVLARGAVRGSANGDRLFELYKTWKSLSQSPSP
jgi:hypothetical protein